MAQDAQGSLEEILGDFKPVTIQASNGAVVNFTFIVQMTRAEDTLRRFAEALIRREKYGVSIGEEFADVAGCAE